MRKLQKGDIVSIIIYEWSNLICAYLVDSSDTLPVEIKFSRFVIEDDQMKIEGKRGSDLIWASLLKTSNAKWLVDEAIYQ